MVEGERSVVVSRWSVVVGGGDRVVVALKVRLSLAWSLPCSWSSVMVYGGMVGGGAGGGGGAVVVIAGGGGGGGGDGSRLVVVGVGGGLWWPVPSSWVPSP